MTHLIEVEHIILTLKEILEANKYYIEKQPLQYQNIDCISQLYYYIDTTDTDILAQYFSE